MKKKILKYGLFKTSLEKSLNKWTTKAFNNHKTVNHEKWEESDF